MRGGANSGRREGRGRWYVDPGEGERRRWWEGKREGIGWIRVKGKGKDKTRKKMEACLAPSDC